jgi:hypothetical protein
MDAAGTTDPALAEIFIYVTPLPYELDSVSRVRTETFAVRVSKAARDLCKKTLARSDSAIWSA